MSTPTDFSSPDATSAIVLTHPAFDRPPVHNERRPGPKKGTHSLAKASRERDAANVRFLLSAGKIERRAGFDEGYALADQHIREGRLPLGALECGAKSDAATAPTPTTRSRHEQAVIDAALAILEAGLAKPGAVLDHPMRVKDYLRLQLAGREREAFGVLSFRPNGEARTVMFFDVRQRLIAFEVLFEGTLTHTAVHPREVARRALQLNAACVVLAHNHPSGVTEASRSDELLTCLLQKALTLFDVRVLDHVIVAGNGALSFCRAWAAVATIEAAAPSPTGRTPGPFPGWRGTYFEGAHEGGAMTNKARPTPAQRHAVRVGSARMLRDAREVLKAIREQLPTVPASDHRDALEMTLKAAEEVAATIARHREPDWAAACALLDATERLSMAAAGGWPNPGLMALMFGAHQGLGMARLATHEAERRSERRSRRTSIAAQLRTLAEQHPGLAAYALNRMLPRLLDESTARREVRKVRGVKRVK